MATTFTIRSGIEVSLAELPERAYAPLLEQFTYANPEFSKKNRLGFWTGDTPRQIEHYALDVDTLIFPRGGTRKIARVMRELGCAFTVRDERLTLPSVDFVLTPKAVPPDPRPHQQRMISAAIAGENCLIRAATSSGKSEAALEIVRKLRQPALVIVNSSSLQRQWVDRVRLRWGWPESEVGLLGGGKRRIRDITIAMQQSLWSGAIDEVADKFGAVVYDEVQAAAAKTCREVIGRFPARYRIGISADERRKDRLDFLIRDLFGEVAEEVSSQELEAKGLVCPVDIVLVPTDFTVSEVDAAPPEERAQVIGLMYPEILGRMEDDPDRNSVALRVAAREARAGRTTIVFCERLELCRGLARSLALSGVPCGLMLGGPENLDAFLGAKARLTSGKLKCAVGTKKVYQGEDIPRLESGVVVTPTAANRQLLNQQRGRLARLAPGKERGTLYYLWDVRLFPRVRDNLAQWFGESAVRVEEI